jgi:hypothetical protein
MENGLHITGHADDQVVDLVIAEPKGRVLGLYRGNNGEIAITAAEARFLLEALPALVARAEYLDHMGPLPPMDSAEVPDARARVIDANNAAGRCRANQGEDSAMLAATSSGQGDASRAGPEPKPSPKPRGRDVQRQRSGRARAGQPWRSCEDTALISGYRSGQDVKDLARVHGRSAKAIELRLERLGIRQVTSRAQVETAIDLAG